MKIIKDLRNAAIAATVIGAPLGIYPIAAQAAPAASNACQSIVHDSTEGWDKFGTDATAKVTENGVRITTPNKVSRIRWSTAVGGEMVNLKTVSYRTFSHSDGDRGSAAPAVRIVLSNGKTLVFEPYFNDTLTEGTWQTWQVVADDSKLWDSSDATQTNKTWAQWLELYGDSATIASVNVGMGTWNEGADARVNQLRVANKSDCLVYSWAKAAEPSPSVTPSTSASATASPLPSTSTTATTEPKPTQSTTTAAPGLPVTGDRTGMFAGIGALALLAGGAILFLARRKRDQRFEA